ncbi:MAG TPA: DNA translocase FtsK 4TM domain-containing protein, partial [Chthoniobacteraceae bacterium]|nr:DNA translocase FtsK 4TM domain-containing protein [Chthoniobacteraceae bacterium]
MPRAQQNRNFNEALGFVLLAAGTLLFLALVSFDPKQIPAWFPLSTTASSTSHSSANYIGPAGAILASCFYFLIGIAASFLASVTLLGYGGAMLLSVSRPSMRQMLWVAAFLISGACLFDLQPWFFRNLSMIFNAKHYGNGGLIGDFLVGKHPGLLCRILGTIGSSIFLLGVYLSSLIMMTGIHPILILRRLVALPPELWEKYYNYRLARASERGRLDLEQKRMERQARKLEKQLSKKGYPAPQSEPADDGDELNGEGESPAVNRPAPKVIDTSVATPKKPDAKKKDKLVPQEPRHFDDYILPGIDLLAPAETQGRTAVDPEELIKIQATVIETLAQFGISVEPGDITKGPTITRYEVYPAKGVRVDRIVSLERDIARATRAERINILAPIPGKDTVGIEIANSRKVKVTLRELLESEDWAQSTASIPLALGKDVYGKTIIGDLAAMPHCLIAGTTGSGKSVCINSIIASMLYRFTPEEIRFIMIDPKVVEMQTYNSLPHLVIPVVTDAKKVLLALRWVIDEMETRYRIFAKTGVRNITSFNARPQPKSQAELDALNKAKAPAKPAPEEVINFDEKSDDELFTDDVPEPDLGPIRVPRDEEIIVPEKMPYIVVIVDELADLMQTSSADVEVAIGRIAQKARAAGIHMILATQTPRADVITGVIKANIPSRIAFQVASGLDSRIILDEKGAERLLGHGDMLYLPPATSRLTRAQGAFVTDDEIREIVSFVSKQGTPAFEASIHEKMQAS